MLKRWIIPALLLAMPFTLQAAPEWMSSPAAAEARAAQSGHCLLVLFTGSDWCRPCNRLKQEVLNSPELEQFLRKRNRFTLLEIDLPRDKQRIGEAAFKTNFLYSRRYNVGIFPTVLVLHPRGFVLGGFLGCIPCERVTAILDSALRNATLVDSILRLPPHHQAAALRRYNDSLPEDIRISNTALLRYLSSLPAPTP